MALLYCLAAAASYAVVLAAIYGLLCVSQSDFVMMCGLGLLLPAMMLPPPVGILILVKQGASESFRVAVVPVLLIATGTFPLTGALATFFCKEWAGIVLSVNWWGGFLSGGGAFFLVGLFRTIRSIRFTL